jgi:hypothetical protein
MKAGPKAAVDPTVLPFRPRSTGSARFAAFSTKFFHQGAEGQGCALAVATAGRGKCQCGATKDREVPQKHKNWGSFWSGCDLALTCA